MDAAEKLSGMTALVTGASRGIGRAISLRLAAQGAQIILHYHEQQAAAEEVVKTIGREVKVVQADLASVAAIQAMFQQLGNARLNFLINNAGIWRETPLGASPEALVNEMIDTNLKGPFWVTQCALPLLEDGGRIINISSAAGRTAVAGGRSLYGATKAALDSLTRNWALELAPRRILVNAVAPGYVTTDMTVKYLSDQSTRRHALDRHPLGRFAMPEDVADVVAFLCSEEARFITGQSINVSGGFVI
jgi:NAD(P)-dependent dehydrogenase (short-subunit alcohol dehydrogenase family)